MASCATGAPEVLERGFSKPAMARINGATRVARRSHRLRRALQKSVGKGGASAGHTPAGSNIDQITPSLNAASVGCRGSLELSQGN